MHMLCLEQQRLINTIEVNMKVVDSESHYQVFVSFDPMQKFKCIKYDQHLTWKSSFFNKPNNILSVKWKFCFIVIDFYIACIF